MIIGEEMNKSSFDSYQEDNYDYLFKRKTPTQRQQKKAEKRQMPPSAPGFKKRPMMSFGLNKKKNQNNSGLQSPNRPNKNHLIQRNFGLFKKPLPKPEPAPAPVEPISEAAPMNEPEIPSNLPTQEPISAPSSEENSSSTTSSNSSTEQAEPTPEPVQEEAPSETEESSEPGDSYDEPVKKGDDSPSSSSGAKKDEKKSGSASVFGWVCLGLTVIIIGVAVASSGSEEKDASKLIKSPSL